MWLKRGINGLSGDGGDDFLRGGARRGEKVLYFP